MKINDEGLVHFQKITKIDYAEHDSYLVQLLILHTSNKFWAHFRDLNTKSNKINTSYLTDSYIVFTLKLESGQKFCSNRWIRSSTYGKKNISDFPPCGKMVIFVTEFVIFLKTSK